MGITPLSTLYCDDEAIYAFRPDDFAVLVPKDQVVLQGSDGRFDPDDPWTMSTASDLPASGVQAGMMVVLSVADKAARPAWWQSSGALYAVRSVGAGGLTLRNPGMSSVAGMPPGPSAALPGVSFAIRTFLPQIENCSNDLNREFAIDPRIPGRGPSDLYEIRSLRKACALRVLHERIVSASRGDKDRWAYALAQVKEALDAETDALSVRWLFANNAATSHFGTRVSR